MDKYNEKRKELIEKAKLNKKLIAKFDISDIEIDQHLLEIAKILNTNEKCESNKDNRSCGADGYHFILVKDNNGKITLENHLCPKITNNPEFLISNNFLYLSPEVNNNMQRLSKNNIFIDGDKYKYRAKFLNTLLNIKREKVDYPGIYVYGELGCGKSYILLAFCNEMALKNKGVIYITMNDFCASVNRSIRDNTNFKSNIMDELMYADVVIFDELGNETYKDYIHNQIIYPILNYRLNNNKLTIFSTKYNINGLTKIYKLGSKDSNIDQFMDRIKRLCPNGCIFNITPFNN